MLTESKQHMMFTKAKWCKNCLGIAYDRTVKQIEDEYLEDPEKRFDERMALVFLQISRYSRSVVSQVAFGIQRLGRSNPVCARLPCIAPIYDHP